MACEPENVEYTPNNDGTYTKTETRLEAEEDGTLKEVEVQENVDTADPEAEATIEMCKSGIQDKDQGLIDAACPDNESQPHIRWDAPTSVCFRETTSKLKNVDPPETVYEVEIIDNGRGSLFEEDQEGGSFSNLLDAH